MMMGFGLFLMLVIGLVVIGLPVLVILIAVGGGSTAWLSAWFGRLVPPTASSPTAPAASTPVRKCPACGREVLPAWNVCPSCSAALT